MQHDLEGPVIMMAGKRRRCDRRAEATARGGAVKRPGWALALSLACALTGPAPVRALTDITPYVSVAAEHNSNVFARSADSPPYAATGNTDLGDTLFKYLAGLDTDFAWERDRLRLDGDVQRFNYDRFTGLNHYEYKFDGDLDYHLGPVVDGSLVYAQQRIMTPPADTLSDQLELQTDRSATATVRLLITPQWRFDVAPNWHELDSPLPQYPQFGLRESGGSGSINYLGINKLVAGVKVEYVDGSYHEIIAATRYHEITEELTASYALTGLSSFDGKVGFTERNSSLVNPSEANAPGAGAGGVVGRTSAFTGQLGLRRKLSVKTFVYAGLFRRIESYVTGANTEIGTGGDLGVVWDPDVKFTVSLHYMQETESIQGNLAIANFVNRTDHLRTAELFVKYHIRDWLTLRPYVSRDDRGSNYPDASYTATVVGIDLTARWQ